MSKPATGTGKPRGVANWIAMNDDLILELPEPGQQYRMHDVVTKPEQFETVRVDLPEEFATYTREFRLRGVIHAAEWDADHNRHLWRTDRQVYEYVSDIHDQVDTLPCNHHSGFETIEAGEIYECGHEFCDATHDYETVAEVYG